MPTARITPAEYLTGPEAQRLLRYENTAAFYDFVRRAGVPFIKVNSRRCLFPAADLRTWLSVRSSIAGTKQ